MNEWQKILPDIPRYYTALAEWLACVVIIFHIKKRFTGFKLAILCTFTLVIQILFLEGTGGLEGVWWLLCMIAAIGLMVLFIALCADTNGKDALYYGAYAFLMAETAASLEWQLYLFGCEKYAAYGVLYEYTVLILSYGAMFFVFWKLCGLFLEKEQRLDVESKDLLAVIVLTGSVFFVSNLGFVTENTPFSGLYAREIFNIRTFADIAGLAALFAYHIQWRDQKVRRELESIRSILHSQYIQYQQSQQTLELIHYKYHDLKHYIIALRAEQKDGGKNACLDRLEEEIRQYETQNKTGNEVLDTLLGAKGMECQKEGIELTCVADGSLLGFMDVMDICSIFGNALDNAIECEKKLAEPEKRMIHLHVSSKRNFLMIKIENYYEGKIRFEQELPVTTKKEKEFHGYGLKSLKYTVHQYKGEVDISTEHNWFCLRILIPLP